MNVVIKLHSNERWSETVTSYDKCHYQTAQK